LKQLILNMAYFILRTAQENSNTTIENRA